MNATALVFQSTAFDIVDRNGQPWLRVQQIAVALGYKRRDVLQQVYAAHADEFTESMTAVVKLPTAGGEQETRIFSLRGCHLLAMLSRTKIAKEFRRWVLDILDKEIGATNPRTEPEAADAPGQFTLSRTSRNQRGNARISGNKNPRSCGQKQTFHRFTSAQIFLH
ncbi:MAG: BRO family protein, partial [Sulfuricellaceae bacterium]